MKRIYYTAEMIREFAAKWPCCDIPEHNGWAEYDDNGELVDMCPTLFDAPCEPSGGSAAFLTDLRAGELATPVIFRVLTRDPQKGETIALFPTLIERNGLVQSYMHVGQHGSADYAGMIRESRKATPSEYAPLMRELQGSPFHYNLIPYDRKPRI